jgi:uncharacterized protein YbjT (DUF2867 family)
MRIVIFGANGPTGRLLTRLSLTAGYDTVAVTRQPGTFGVQSPRLRVAGADVLDADAVDSLVEGSDADWTILRPSGLYELPEVTDYSLTENTGRAGSPPGSTWPPRSCGRSRTTVSSAGPATSSPRGTTPACSR